MPFFSPRLKLEPKLSKDELAQYSLVQPSVISKAPTYALWRNLSVSAAPPVYDRASIHEALSELRQCPAQG